MATVSHIEERVGRAAHEAWKRWIVQNGYARHQFLPHKQYLDSPPLTKCGYCRLPAEQHHEDMVPWEELPSAKRGKYVGMGMAGYEIGKEVEPRLEITW